MPIFAVSSKNLAVVILVILGVTGLIFIRFAKNVAKVLLLNQDGDIAICFGKLLC